MKSPGWNRIPKSSACFTDRSYILRALWFNIVTLGSCLLPQLFVEHYLVP